MVLFQFLFFSIDTISGAFKDSELSSQADTRRKICFMTMNFLLNEFAL